VLRDADDPNSVWLVHDTDVDVSAIEAMFSEPELAKLMQAAGVTGPPQYWLARPGCLTR
jgi:hypothetical protein